MGVAHSSLPLASDRHQTTWLVSRLLMPYIRPAATDGALYPPPRPLIFHARGGPSLGHSLSRPVSFETASRFGPCHCGQSKDRGESGEAAKAVGFSGSDSTD